MSKKLLLFILAFNLKFKHCFPAQTGARSFYGKPCSVSYLQGSRRHRGCEAQCGVLELEGAISSRDVDVLDSISGKTVDAALPDGNTAFYDFASNAITHGEVFIKVQTLIGKKFEF